MSNLYIMIGQIAPKCSVYDNQEKWIIENEGVTTDIGVELNSEETSNGKDAQLRKGINVLMEKIKDNPRTWPEHKPYPTDDQAK